MDIKVTPRQLVGLYIVLKSTPLIDRDLQILFTRIENKVYQGLSIEEIEKLEDMYQAGNSFSTITEI
jgi:hypothetical protein